MGPGQQNKTTFLRQVLTNNTVPPFYTITVTWTADVPHAKMRDRSISCSRMPVILILGVMDLNLLYWTAHT